MAQEYDNTGRAKEFPTTRIKDDVKMETLRKMREDGAAGRAEPVFGDIENGISNINSQIDRMCTVAENLHEYLLGDFPRKRIVDPDAEKKSPSRPGHIELVLKAMHNVSDNLQYLEGLIEDISARFVTPTAKTEYIEGQMPGRVL